MKTFKLYVSHNKFSPANPSAYSPSQNEVVFDLDKISKSLQNKVIGYEGLMELTIQEINQIFEARTTIRSVSKTVVERLFQLNNF